MNNHNLIQQISMAIASAVLRDLPDLACRHWTPQLRNQGVPREDAPESTRRPREHEVEVVSFPQAWGSTALGFGGLGGAAMTTAQTTLVSMRSPPSAAVYFGSRLAYCIDEPNDHFWNDVRERRLRPCAEAEAYGAVRRPEVSP